MYREAAHELSERFSDLPLLNMYGVSPCGIFCWNFKGSQKGAIFYIAIDDKGGQ